jgi:isopenicillin N synthase-like dioxygenase
MSSTDKTTSAAVERGGKFINVDPNPGTIIVNVGYLLMRWTNGRWKSISSSSTGASPLSQQQHGPRY